MCSGVISGLTPPLVVSFSSVTSITATGPIIRVNGSCSSETVPNLPSCGRPEPGGGMKWLGASMWVPQCSSSVSHAVWYGPRKPCTGWI